MFLKIEDYQSGCNSQVENHCSRGTDVVEEGDVDGLDLAQCGQRLIFFFLS